LRSSSPKDWVLARKYLIQGNWHKGESTKTTSPSKITLGMEIAFRTPSLLVSAKTDRVNREKVT
jgi:hypothetical protein